MINISSFVHRYLSLRSLCALALLTLASCTPAEDIRYTLHNASGRLVVAAIAGDAAAERVATTEDLANGTMVQMRGWPERSGDSVTVQWLSGPGRARWHEASIPLTLSQSERHELHFYLRSDQLVCASFEANDALATSLPGKGAKCVKSIELAPLAPGMARAISKGSVTRNSSFFAEHASPPRVYTTLDHPSGQIELAGNDEFFSAPVLGDQAGLLVDAVGDGTFVLTADQARWRTRYLGKLKTLGEPQPRPRKMFYDDNYRSRALIDTATGDIFFFPGQPHREYWILGESPNGKHVVIAVPQQAFDIDNLRETDFNLQVIDLENGKILTDVIANMPRIPGEEGIEVFFGAWYTKHCTWSPLLNCTIAANRAP